MRTEVQKASRDQAGRGGKKKKKKRLEHKVASTLGDRTENE